MSITDVLLIIISGLGVVHGLFLTIFLFTYRKGNLISNKILGVLLFVLSFRVGKSVIMEFATDIDIKLIFVGLGALMTIGPLYYLYTLSIVNKDFRVKKRFLIHFVPAVMAIGFGLWINDPTLESTPKVFIATLFITYYLHYLTYLIFSFVYIIQRHKQDISQGAYKLLRLFFYGLLIIWIAYVLNLFDEIVPYIVGPILYTCVAYVISFIVIQKEYLKTIGVVKYKTTAIPEDQIDVIYNKVFTMVVTEQQFKNPNLTLKLLSKRLNVSTQVLSMVINKQYKTNFNNFINHYRIEESIAMFRNKEFDNLTIASIAFEVGFNSISSFNTSFKKETGKTPLALRKTLSE